ncbi:NDR1/HIN1-like protein 13 [Vitis vinifera]|uniref:NDR1/HIN1-like protein 13 n=1 Tax=Vitis vinifera TaxID=29760 RepID=A0A438F8I4_VITVI|nr:NDR1/HIN1-like protein 13 [Vitis vinifera]
MEIGNSRSLGFRVEMFLGPEDDEVDPTLGPLSNSQERTSKGLRPAYEVEILYGSPAQITSLGIGGLGHWGLEGELSVTLFFSTSHCEVWHQLIPFPCNPSQSSKVDTLLPPLSTAPHLSMEERVPPVTDAHGNTDLFPDSQNIFRSGTYVVQVPKDQIYRVPPPENALIAERHRSPAQKKKSYRSRCFILCILICIIAVIVAIAAAVSSRVLHPKSPIFHIQHLVVTKSSHSRPQYKITLKAKNPNSHTGITYEAGGHVSLSFKNHEIADGDCPTFSQGQKDSTVFVVPLSGSKSALPKEIERSIKSQNSTAHTSLSLSLSMDYPIKRRVWLFKRGKRLAVLCNVTVDTLAKGTRVLSQECHS